MKTTHKITATLALAAVIFCTPVLAQRNANDQRSMNDITASSLSLSFELSLLSVEVGALNNINIGSISAGGGAGKATFKELRFTKRPDAATSELLRLLTTGEHMDQLVITQGNSRWELGLVMVSDYTSQAFSGKDGEQVESWELQFGGIRTIVEGSEWCWDRVTNASCN